MDALSYISVIMLVSIFFVLLNGIYQKNTNALCMSKKRLHGKTALITGGTTGMGLETAKDFAQRGARVIVACPFEDEGRQAVDTIIENSENKNVVFKLLDLASFESTRKFAAEILKVEDRLDILINNAGVVGPRSSLSRDGLNFVVQVNYFGAFLLTILLLPLLKRTGRAGEPSRIVNITSAVHTFGRVNFKKLDISNFFLEGYSNSKLYLVLFSRELTKRLQRSNVVINSADPGLVGGTKLFYTATQFSYISLFFAILYSILFKNPWEGAQTALHVALEKRAGEVSGEFFKNCKQALAVRKAYNDEMAKKLFEESIRLVKLTNEELDQCFKSCLK